MVLSESDVPNVFLCLSAESVSYLSLQDILNFPMYKGEKKLAFCKGCHQEDTVKSSQEVIFLYTSSREFQSW